MARSAGAGPESLRPPGTRMAELAEDVGTPLQAVAALEHRQTDSRGGRAALRECSIHLESRPAKYGILLRMERPAIAERPARLNRAAVATPLQVPASSRGFHLAHWSERLVGAKHDENPPLKSMGRNRAGISRGTAAFVSGGLRTERVTGSEGGPPAYEVSITLTDSSPA